MVNKAKGQSWHNKTYTRSGSGIIAGSEKFSVFEVKPETQAHKLKRAMNRVSKQIKRDIEEKNKSNTSPDRKAFLEKRIRKKEEIYYWKQVRLQTILEPKIKTKDKRFQTTIENEKKSIQVLQIKSENYRKYLENNPEIRKKIELVDSTIPFREKRKQRIVKGRNGQRTIQNIPNHKLFGEK